MMNQNKKYSLEYDDKNYKVSESFYTNIITNHNKILCFNTHFFTINVFVSFKFCFFKGNLY